MGEIAGGLFLLRSVMELILMAEGLFSGRGRGAEKKEAVRDLVVRGSEALARGNVIKERHAKELADSVEQLDEIIDLGAEIMNRASGYEYEASED